MHMSGFSKSAITGLNVSLDCISAGSGTVQPPGGGSGQSAAAEASVATVVLGQALYNAGTYEFSGG